MLGKTTLTRGAEVARLDVLTGRGPNLVVVSEKNPVSKDRL
jgi:hypothetical protein